MWTWTVVVVGVVMHMLVIVQFRGGGYEVAWRGGRNEEDGLGVDDEKRGEGNEKDREEKTGNR
jgi:hypothetical protein